MTISAKVIAHSKAPNDEELITLEVEFHRFILPELNTHRVFSRNYQSSRAVPIKNMIEQVRNNPATPIHWGSNQAGMVADNEVVGGDKWGAIDTWTGAANIAANQAEVLNSLGLHKQIVNRLLEPFMWTKGVITTTRDGFNSFFKLRIAYDAQPEIQALAKEMKRVIDESVPQLLQYGEYHLPYVAKYDEQGNPSFYDDPTEAIKISCSCCAQVSYRKLDDSLEKALRVYDMLNLPVEGKYPEGNPHFSPAEHIAKVVDGHEYPHFMSGNFNSDVFWQYRKALELGDESEFISP